MKFKAILYIVAFMMFTGPAVLRAAEIDVVKSEFHFFIQKRMVTIQSSYLYSKERPELIKKGGRVIAQYPHPDRTSLDMHVSPTDQPGVYTGVLSYIEYLMQAVGSDSAGARSGEFRPVSGTRMTELFLYKDGQWQK